MAHRSRLGGIIIDCRTDDLDAAAAFWSGALGAERKDIESDDIPAEVARLTKLGATKIAEIKAWVVMQAPTGQRFCVVEAGTADFDAKANAWEE